jgi:hypothetical protein
MNLPQVSVVIPCLNESETLELCIREALEAFQKSGLSGEVVVADNGSTDNSREIAERAGAVVVPVKRRGYGAALHGGILGARGELVVFGDADCSYPFSELSKLIAPLQKGEADFVLGSRLQGTIESGAMPLLNRHIGTPVLSCAIRQLHGLPTSDCNSGMRAFRRADYEALDLRCPGMEYASEMLVRLARSGLRYKEVTIGFRKDRRSRPPHLKRWRDGWRHLRYILGTAPASGVVAIPGILGLVALLGAFVLSFQNYWAPGTELRFHSAFSLVAIALPLLLLATSLLMVRVAAVGAGIPGSAWLTRLEKWSETSAPFYWACLLFVLSAVQIGFIFDHWSERNFGSLYEIDGVIRAVVGTTLGSALLAMDLGLGLIRLFVPADTAVEPSKH